MKTIRVVDYDSEWPRMFEEIRGVVWPAVSEVAIGMEHVGSTAVPGLAAKPVIDACVIVASKEEVQPAVARLETIGYQHRGNLGVADREAFKQPEGLPKHHLYLSPQESLSLINHLGVRDYLRAHPEAVAEYGALKKQLAQKFQNDIDGYIDGKTDFILRVLRAVGLSDEDLGDIERLNRLPNIVRPGPP